MGAISARATLVAALSLPQAEQLFSQAVIPRFFSIETVNRSQRQPCHLVVLSLHIFLRCRAWLFLDRQISQKSDTVVVGIIANTASRLEPRNQSHSHNNKTMPNSSFLLFLIYI